MEKESIAALAPGPWMWYLNGIWRYLRVTYQRSSSSIAALCLTSPFAGYYLCLELRIVRTWRSVACADIHFFFELWVHKPTSYLSRTKMYQNFIPQVTACQVDACRCPKFSIDYCGRLRLLLCSASRILKCPSSAMIRWAFQLASHLKILPDLKPNAYHMIFRHYQPLKRSSESLPYKIKQGRLVVKIHQKYQLQHPSKIIFWLQPRLDASHHFVKSWAHRSHGIGDQVLGDLRSKIPQGCQLEIQWLPQL